jgi:hypothetical protein
LLFSVLIILLRRDYEASAKQIDPRPSIHLAFDRLEPVHVAFDSPLPPANQPRSALTWSE